MIFALKFRNSVHASVADPGGGANGSVTPRMLEELMHNKILGITLKIASSINRLPLKINFASSNNPSLKFKRQIQNIILNKADTNM